MTTGATLGSGGGGVDLGMAAAGNATAGRGAAPLLPDLVLISYCKNGVA